MKSAEKIVKSAEKISRNLNAEKLEESAAQKS